MLCGLRSDQKPLRGRAERSRHNKERYFLPENWTTIPGLNVVTLIEFQPTAQVNSTRKSRIYIREFGMKNTHGCFPLHL